MAEPSLPELEDQRARLYAELAAVGDFRRGSISENYRRFGKPNCACAQPDHPGHGPRYLWTRTVAGRGTRGRQLSAEEIDGALYIVSELVRGRTLREELKAGPLPPDQLRATLLEVAEGLAAAHAQGIVHRWSPSASDSTGLLSAP